MQTPKNLEAENYVLAAIAKDLISYQSVTYDDFFDIKNKLIFKSILSLKEYLPVHATEIWKELEKEGKNGDAGNEINIIDVIDRPVVSKEQANYWLNELKEATKERKSLKISQEISDQVLSGKYNSDDLKKKVDELSEVFDSDKKSKLKKKKYIAKFENLVDLVLESDEVKFLILENDTPSVVESIELEGELYFPPPRNKLPFRYLPRAIEVLEYFYNDSDSSLFNDMIQYHKDISELPSNNHYILLATWVLHTYLIEKFEYSPYLWLYAVPERGKSRTGKGCIYLAYRGLHVESLREAYLFRITNSLGSSLFIDVMDLWKKAEKSGSEDILLTRFEKGFDVPRVINPEKGPFEDTVYYKIFGPTIIGTNVNIHPILETRAILISMPECSKEFNTEVTPENALNLKERLTAFRARHMNTGLPSIKKIVSGRLGDITKPLLQMLHIVNPDYIHELNHLIYEIENQKKIQNSESIDAKILLALYRLSGEVESGILHVSKITGKHNKLLDKQNRLTPQKVGWRLSALGFRKGRDRKGAYIEYNSSLIEKLKNRFGLNINATDNSQIIAQDNVNRSTSSSSLTQT